MYFLTFLLRILEDVKLGPIKKLLPEVSFGKIKLALAQMQKSFSQAGREVRKFNTALIDVEHIGSQNNEM